MPDMTAKETECNAMQKKTLLKMCVIIMIELACCSAKCEHSKTTNRI
jgi:hypothetical protein